MLIDAKKEETEKLEQDKEFNSSMFPESIKDTGDADLLGDGLLVQDDNDDKDLLLEGIEPELLKSGDDRKESNQDNDGQMIGGLGSPTDKIDVLKFLKESADSKVEDGKGEDGQADDQEVIVSDLGEEVEIIDPDLQKGKGTEIARIETIVEADNEAEEEEDSCPGSEFKNIKS